MTDKPESISFQLEANTKHCDPRIYEDAMLILKDPESTLREKLLARAVCVLVLSHNEMVDALELGQVTLTVFEKDIRHEKRP